MRARAPVCAPVCARARKLHKLCKLHNIGKKWQRRRVCHFGVIVKL